MYKNKDRKNNKERKTTQNFLAFLFLNGFKNGTAHRMSINNPSTQATRRSSRRPIKKASTGKGYW